MQNRRVAWETFKQEKKEGRLIHFMALQQHGLQLKANAIVEMNDGRVLVVGLHDVLGFRFIKEDMNE